MSECTKCEREVCYPHIVIINAHIEMLCDDCYDSVSANEPLSRDSEKEQD